MILTIIYLIVMLASHPVSTPATLLWAFMAVDVAAVLWFSNESEKSE
ncbi:MAG: hypothetical protein ABIA93_06065 [Candidatus Woesearchaeota archaeon]